MTLTEFLLARIAEDEDVAREVRPDEYQAGRDDLDLWVADAGVPAFVATTSGRVLAECEAKRRIVYANACDLDRSQGTLRWLAMPYADRPGYREEWKP